MKNSIQRTHVNATAVFNAILRSDLYSFVQAAFRIASPGDSIARNWHLEAVTYALTRVLQGESKRLIITVPPRSLKSICASVAFPAFVLGRDPTRGIICVSYSEGTHSLYCNIKSGLVDVEVRSIATRR